MGTFSLSSLFTYLAIQMVLKCLVPSKPLLSETGLPGQPTAILTSLSFCKHCCPAAGSGGGALAHSRLELMIFSE